MADLTNVDKRSLEIVLGMASGYLLDFTNRTFASFVEESVGVNIYEAKYNRGSGSKANRMRAFWSEQPNHVVAHLLRKLIAYGKDRKLLERELNESLRICERAIARLEHATAVSEVDALGALGNDYGFDVLAQEIRNAICTNRLEAGLDRLHTFSVKFVRVLCKKHGLTVERDDTLHSLFGQYVKWLRANGYLESKMSERILRASISIFDAFNDVRNNRSLAHDNELLTYDESLLIFNHVSASIRFLRSLEQGIDSRARVESSE